MISRNLSTLEGFYNSSGGMVQFGLKVQQKNRIPEILDILINNVFGLRLRTTNTKMISNVDLKNDPHYANKTQIYSIPPNLDLIRSCQYMYDNHTKPLTEVLGTIGFNNDDIIVLNVSHLVGDGKYFTFILDYLISKLTNTTLFESPESMKPLNELILSSQSNEYQLPINMESLFTEQINSTKLKPPHIFVDEGFAHVKPLTKVENIKVDNTKPCQYISFNFPIKEFRCYNKQNDRCNGLSEVIWSSYILAGAAFNELGDGKIENIFGPDTNSSPGVTTCVDMRQYLKDKSLINWRAANLYSSVTVSAPYSKTDTSLSPSNESLKNFEQRLRNDFINKIQSGFQYAFLNTLTPPDPTMVIPGVGLEVSSVGPYYISRRNNQNSNVNLSKNNIFSDMFIKSSVKDVKCDPLLSYSAYSVINEIEGRKDFYTNMRYKSIIFSQKDANMIGRGTEFAMKNLSPSMTVKEAIESIKQFQRTLL